MPDIKGGDDQSDIGDAEEQRWNVQTDAWLPIVKDR